MYREMYVAGLLGVFVKDWQGRTAVNWLAPNAWGYFALAEPGASAATAAGAALADALADPYAASAPRVLGGGPLSALDPGARAAAAAAVTGAAAWPGRAAAAARPAPLRLARTPSNAVAVGVWLAGSARRLGHAALSAAANAVASLADPHGRGAAALRPAAESARRAWLAAGTPDGAAGCLAAHLTLLAFLEEDDEARDEEAQHAAFCLGAARAAAAGGSAAAGYAAAAAELISLLR